MRAFSPLEQAKALAVVLREEFGVPFAFYNAANGAEIRDEEQTDGAQDGDGKWPADLGFGQACMN